MSNITSKLVINSVEYEIKDEFARNEISTLDSELTLEKDKIIGLDTKTTAQEGQISSLQTTSTDHGGRIATLENDVSSLETQVSNLNLEGSDWELKAVYTGATETLNLTVGKVE